MTAQNANLAGKKIFVTGGSRGIGAAVVKDLASRGAQVAFTYASKEDSARQVLESLPGSGHLMFKMDISSEASVDETFTSLLQQWPEIHGVVNNAGVTKDTLLLRMKTSDFDAVLNTNLRGCFLVTKAAIKPMLKARQGSIVNITSVIGQMGNAGQSNYAASKAGIEAFSKSVALEMGSRGIRVNCVAPGFIKTEMTDGLSEEVKAGIMSKVALGRFAKTQEVASAIAFLLSDESQYITGHTLSVNGGMYMK